MKRDPVGPGQESVWDYPRPPRLEAVNERLRVLVAGHVIGETHNGYRVLETSHPPTYYFPPSDVDGQFIREAAGRSICEWKGAARYWDIVTPEATVPHAAWSYPEPTAAFRPIRDYACFYPSKAESCWVGDEQATAQEGDFYGGWITAKIIGPFKGARGTWGW
ncbi:MAG: DUF427 domain-containing protein [Pseudomonadota bacterium]